MFNKVLMWITFFLFGKMLNEIDKRVKMLVLVVARYGRDWDICDKCNT